ncbi:MAG: hypothetical protein GY719_16960, partial [bacterium]|nr:hypothetical protein [bacterium]
MSRPAVLAFACLACFLVLLPLAPKKPGLPMQLFGEEATWFLMASSLARDGDLRLDAGETHRLFDQFPFTPEARLELASADGWQSVRYARPVPYPLFAAPFVAVFGANGLVTLNALLLVLSIGLGAAYLRRWNSDGVALLASAGFFVLSAAFAYLFRMQPQIFIMATVTACLYFSPGGGDSGQRSAGRPWLSGLALALAIGHEPALALLAVPVLTGLLASGRRGTGRRAVVSWMIGFVATLAAVAGLSLAWTGEVFLERPAADVATASFVVESPLEAPWTPGETGAVAIAATDDGAHRSFGDWLEDFGFLLWGRRAGALPYFPWLIPVLVLFAVATRRSSRQWVLFASLLALAVLQSVLEPAAAHGEQIGNPHLVGVVPAFLFLLTRLPAAAVISGTVLGAVSASTLLLTPYGSAVPGAPMQAHARNFPFALLPFEYPALGRTPGFHEVELHGLDAGSRARLWAPADQSEAIGSDLWTLGGESAELWIESRAELPPLVFNLRNL